MSKAFLRFTSTGIVVASVCEGRDYMLAEQFDRFHYRLMGHRVKLLDAQQVLDSHRLIGLDFPDAGFRTARNDQTPIGEIVVLALFGSFSMNVIMYS